MKRAMAILSVVLLCGGCETLFGWHIHAPGVLSANYYSLVNQSPERIALYIPPETRSFISTDKGGTFADPETHYVGEAVVPMLIEAFQEGFAEFVYCETSPTKEILTHYGVPLLAEVRVTHYDNTVTVKGQKIEVQAEVIVYDSQMQERVRFRADGASDAKKVFKKKGGPEVNMNAALESMIITLVQFLQDSLR